MFAPQIVYIFACFHFPFLKAFHDLSTLYFGQPAAGFFFCRDILIAPFQSMLILSLSGSGPRFGLSFDRGIFGLIAFICFEF